MNYRSTLMTAGAAVALAGLATAQTNGDYDHNWASLSAGPAAIVVGPATFGGVNSIGDSMRECYSIDVSQGGRNQTGQTYISWFDVAQAFGGLNPTLGVDIGQVMIGSRVTDDLGDDACLSDIFITTGTAYQGASGDINAGLIGLIGGTGGYSLNQGFFWNIAFEFIGTNLPGVSNTAGADPASAFAGTPLLTHLVYEVQGPVGVDPVDGSLIIDPNNKQYFLGSTSELNGVGAATGGVTNGNSNFGLATYGVDAVTSGAVQGNRITIANETPALTGAGPLALLGGTGGELEFLGAIALQTPYLAGRNNGNMGGGGADWTVSGGTLSTLDVQITDKLSGGQNPGSGAVVEDPLLLFNAGFLVWSATPAVATLQNALSWDDLGGFIPPQAGSAILPPQATTRAGLQRIHVNFDATTSTFLSLGFSLNATFTGAQDPNLDAGGVGDLFDIQGTSLGASTFATGPVALGTPAPGAAGSRLGIHALEIQVNAATGGAIEFAELTNARTAVLQ
ncbi:MAG: hypothetical protein ACYTFV_00690 [Planctomycetota bacterium]|jgi:hypothetical protein